MRIKDFAFKFLTTFALVLIVTVIVTLLWNYVIKGIGLIVDWETSFRMAFIFACVIPLLKLEKKD